MNRQTVLKLVLTGLLITVLLYKVNIFEIFLVILAIDLVYLVFAITLVPVLLIIRTVRWQLLLQSVGIDLPFPETLKVLLIGIFYGLVTPGHIGEIGRAYHLDSKKVITLPTIVLEKIIDIGTLIGLSLITFFLFFPENQILITIIAMLGFLIVAGILIFFNERFVFLVTQFFRVNREDMEQFSANFMKLLKNFPGITFSFILSLIYYIMAYFIGYLVVISAGFTTISVVTLPLIVLMGNIPLTIAGLGIRESVGSLTFLYLGESAADGFTFAFLLFVIISLLPACAGYVLAMREGDNPKQTGQITGILSPFLESWRMRQITAIVTRGAVLDFGCGNGKLAGILQFTHYSGTDQDSEVIAKAKTVYSGNRSISFYSMDEFKGCKEKYQYIILSAVIEHFPDPGESLKELLPLLDPDGRIIITTPTPLGNRLLEIGSFFGLFSRSAFEEHNRIFSRNDFIRLSRELNLKIQRYNTFEMGLNQLVVMSRDE